MKFNEKLYLKEFLSVNSNHIYSSYQNLRSYGNNTHKLFDKVNTTQSINGRKPALKVLLSGRIRGVSMARSFKMSSAALSKNMRLERIEKENKIIIKERNVLNIVSSLIDKKKVNNHHNSNATNLAVQPQTLNSIGSYRLQYVNKEIYTK
jgi:hypothetical protein